jgi:anti-sigma-K factor RskA
VNVRDDVSDYLLGELRERERSAFEAAMAGDPALRAEVERLRPVVARLEALEPGAWELPAPPPLPPLGKAAARRPRRRRFSLAPLVLRPALAGLAAVLLLAAGLGAGLLIGGDGGGQPAGGARVVALSPVEPLGEGAAGEARLAAAGGRAAVRLTGLEPSGRGEFYELWLLGEEGELVSLASFRVPASGAVTVSVPLPADPADFAALDVSVEPADGDPGHSSRSVLRAPLRAS